MTLIGEQLGRIHEVLLAAYSRDELLRLVKVRMEEDFARHVTAEKPFADQVFEFIEWADRQERALELLRCAAEGNPSNTRVQALWAEAQGWETPAPPVEQAELSILSDQAHHIFLTYSRKDEAIMRRLRADLLAAGIVAWVDQDDLEPGTPVWQRAIETAIREANGVVAILTPDAKESEWVNIEISFARRIGRRIYPVLARGNEDNAVPLMLDTTQRIDLRSDYKGGVQNRLIPALHKVLGLTDAAKPVTQTDAPAPVEKKPAGAASPESTSDRGKTSVPDAQGTAPAPKPVAPPKWLRSESAKQPSAQVSPTKPLIIKPPVDIEWVTIPAGEFLMGSDKKKDKKAKDNETPQHRLHLPEFQIAKYPITNAQYQAFVTAAGHQPPEHWKDGVIPHGLENHPVVHVSWYDAQEFCTWAKARLPSEAEWEKAARGTDGRMYPWGNESPGKDRCNFNGNVNDTTPVDRYPKGASPYGVMDMAGNVWEWTNSLWGADLQKQQFGYPYNPNDGRETKDAPNTIMRITRGGSWNRIDPDVRCAYRVYYHPWLRYNVIGFRVVSAGFTMPWQSKGGVQTWR